VTPSAFWALVAGTWREWLSRPLIAVVTLLVCATTVATSIMTRELQGPAFVLSLVIGAGSIGRDVSSGVLPLIFTRPVIRSRYVLAKWLAVGVAVGLLSAASVLVEVAWLAHRGNGVPGAEVGEALFASATTAFGLPAVMVCLSTLVAGVGDVGGWVILNLLVQFAPKLLPLRAVAELQGLIRPELGWDTAFGAGSIAWFPVLSYLSTVTLWLCLAALSLNRKELSYASG
jgi:hypothetical protein